MSIYDLTWKGRLIIKMDGHVDLPPDRQEVVGPEDTDARLEFMKLLNDAVPQKVLFGVIRDKIRTGEIHTRERNEVTLFDGNHEGRHLLITGNSNASFGYFYAEARFVPESTGTTSTYRAEVRFDVVAESPEQARELAYGIASKVPADNVDVTTIFDENWDEIV